MATYSGYSFAWAYPHRSFGSVNLCYGGRSLESWRFSNQGAVMKLVIFGLTVSSSWGNGHATLWRGLCNALAKQGHQVTFFERDVSYYANHRDLLWPELYELVLYSSWAEA